MVESPTRRSGCGLMNAVFGRRTFWLRRATSTGSLPTINNTTTGRISGIPGSKRRRGGSDEAAFLNQTNSSEAASRFVDHPVRPSAIRTKTSQIYNQTQGEGSDGAVKMPQMEAYVNQGRKVPKEAIGISGELEAIIADHQSSKGSSTLVRASSSNVMLFGNLGNLRQPGSGNPPSKNVLDYLPKTTREETSIPNGKKQNEEKAAPSSFCRVLSTRMDPETLKIMGNEDYKNGRFEEALALYDAAISIDPNRASYRSNRSAALTALGRLLEAVFECREALRIEPYYFRAHQRLGNLYLR